MTIIAMIKGQGDMETTWDKNTLETYLDHFRGLIGDKRTWETFGETVKGIIGAGSLVCKRIAAHSSVLSRVADGGQRVIRFVTGESTGRSQVDAEHLTERLRQRGVEQLSQAGAAEIWLIPDGSDLRKPYAQGMPHLMKVRDLDGKLVPGYRTLNVLGVTPGRRGILYHRLFSSQEADFESESAEVQQALRTVGQALSSVKEQARVIWIMDRGFDDVAVWRTIWEQEEHVVCRLCHTDRLVAYQSQAGDWVTGDIERARGQGRLLATIRTEMEVRLGRQRQAKRQEATVEIRATPVRLTYSTDVRRAGPGVTVNRSLWLVEARVLKSSMPAWLLLTDLPVNDEEQATHVFRMYRQRWAVEDSFKFTKTCLNWEDVQLMDMTGIRTLVALAWVVAGFLYELGITLDWPEVQLVARLGGWEARKDRPPGKIVLSRGLNRLIDMVVTRALLDQYTAQHGSLPPRLAALIGPLP